MFLPISCIRFLLYYIFTIFITHCFIFWHRIRDEETKFTQTADWLDQISKSKWTQTYGEGKWYDHMTTNLAEYMNSILKGTWALPITALVNETFNKINYSFVTNDMKIMNMIKARHRYSEDICHDARKSTHFYLALCLHACLRNKGVWGSRNCKHETWSTSNGMLYQIEWMVVWLWAISK